MVFIMISMVFLHPILKLLGATKSILPFAITYARIYIISCIFNVFNVTMNNIVTSEGTAPATIVSQFTKGNAEIIHIGAASLRANGISIMLFGVYTVYSSLFLALGKGREGFILGACRQGICFIPVILLLPMVWGFNGILYAQPIADVLSAIITIFMAIPLHRKLNEMQRQTAAIGINNKDF